MGNCWGSKEEHNAPPTNNTPPEVKNSQAPAPASALTGFVAPDEVVVAKASEGGMTSPPTPAGGKITRPELKVFAYSELKSATRNFRPDSVVGEGGFGRVYKGWIDEITLAPSKVGVGIPVAVKRCSPDSSQGLKEWKAEIDMLGKFSHPNLVKLVGYCWEDIELLLVYEYMQKGSLENHLFKRTVEPPSWSTRIRIVMDAARGLDFLHTSKNTVIYRDFKAANILLDENYGAKLSDFGLARQGPPIDRSHVTTQAVGTYGYAAPEYLNSGHLYIKSDVYGFGVVLLEMLTGKRAYDKDRDSGQTSLAEWYKPMLHNKSKTKKIIDPRMGDYPLEGVYKLAQLILVCLENDPKKRPTMHEVLSLLEKVSTIKMKPKSSRPNSSKSLAHGLEKKPTKAHSYHPSPLHHHNGSSTRPQPHRHTHG